MKNQNQFIYLVLALVLIFLAVTVLEQKKQMDQLSNSFNELNSKYDQSNLAARTALRYSTELVEQVQAQRLQNGVENAGGNGKKIGYKFSYETA